MIVDTQEDGPFDPDNADAIVFFEPPHLSPRIPAQASCFTSHPDPDSPAQLPGSSLRTWQGTTLKVTIPGGSRAGIREALANLGFTRGTLFQDLDSIVVDINARVLKYGPAL